MKALAQVALIVATAVLSGATAQANTVLFTWSGTDTTDHYTLSGQVTFGISNYNPTTGACLSGGCDLTIDLVNTGAQITRNTEFLTGLFFDIQEGTIGATGGVAPGALTLVSGVSAGGYLGTAPANGSICAPKGGTTYEACGGSTDPTSNKGGWQAAYSTSGWSGRSASEPEDWAIGTTAFSNGGNVFNSTAVGTYNYSIIPTSGSTVTNNRPYVIHEADFVLSGLTSSKIYVYSVQAAYGNNPNFLVQGTLVSGEAPEPTTIVMMLLGLGLLLLAQRRHRTP